jgi:glutamate-ammonia-ligase adenylyltransferase
MSVSLEQQYQARLQHYLSADNDAAWLQQKLKDTKFAQQLMLVWGTSDFAADQSIANPSRFRQLVESGDLQRSYPEDHYRNQLQQRVLALPHDPEEQALASALRLFRQREMLRIIWRDFTRQATLLETTADLTRLAEACVTQTLNHLHKKLVIELGTPLDADGNPQQMLVIAMGKMGASELNMSSDIDLIFAYPRAGETAGAKRSVSNQEFFQRLGQKLIATLDRQTAEGFVFRVDMRLRPYGQSGPLVHNFAALEEYYHTQGRDWERYAMVKGRVICGDAADRVELEEILRPFVYRRYLDYGAIESLRDLKDKINREVARKGLQDNIKLGHGGIREVEFIAQVFQLIRGGRLKALQTQSLHRVLEVLAAENLISSVDRQQLWEAYQYLRNTEHVLQAINDKQTQQLPVDELSQQRLARVMGEASWQDFQHQLDRHRAQVHRHFAAIIARDDTRTTDGSGEQIVLWHSEMDAVDSQAVIAGLNYQQPQQIANRLAQFYSSRLVLSLDQGPRSSLDALIPQVLKICSEQALSDTAFERLLELIQAVLRRSAYLRLLLENPQALQQLAVLCSQSSWIADQLTRYPALLDELLDPRHLYAVQQKNQLQDQLQQQTLRLPDDDQEQHMEEVRHFCRASTLRVAAREITDQLPLMQVSDQLTWIAEVAVEHVTRIAWQQMAAKYGVPQVQGSSSPDADTPGFMVVAYGKMGGLEMGYQSDLDLVFLHDNLSPQTRGGVQSIDSTTFITRLGRRIIHMLSTPTAAGRAYEIDMRLRPSGNSGMLVSSLAAFEKYQREDAWTWEHQALVRARAVAGDRETIARFNAIRSRQLCQLRDISDLRTEVVAMREKMRKHLNRTVKGDKYSLKQASGGIVDIEFMVQFAVLAWSHQFNQLTHWSDTIRLLQIMADCGLISVKQCRMLTEAYCAYRSAGHSLQLQNRPAEVPLSTFAEHRHQVKVQWQKFLITTDQHKQEE